MQASANAEAAQRQLDVEHSQEAQLAANLKAAQAALELARINLGYTVIASPVDGLVGQRRVYPGQYVGIGTQVMPRGELSISLAWPEMVEAKNRSISLLTTPFIMAP